MVRLFIVGAWLFMAGSCYAQTATPDVYVFATVESGQMTRFDYVASAGSVHVANLLTFLFFSLWAMFLFAVFVMWKGKRA
jgi:hypothetical protein